MHPPTKTPPFLNATGNMRPRKSRHSQSWAVHLHSPNILCDWGNGQTEHNLLQEAGLPPCWQMGTPLQLNPLLAMMPPLVLPPEFCHPMYQKCTLLLLPRFQVPPSQLTWSLQKHTYHPDINIITMFLLFIYTYFFFSINSLTLKKKMRANIKVC